MIERKESKQTGITLVALVVTIVVLLILAGITITYVLGDNSIIRKAQEAKNRTEEAIQNEQNELAELANLLKNEANSGNESEVATVGMKIKIEPQDIKTEYLVNEALTYIITIENTSSIELNDITISCILEGTKGMLMYTNMNGVTWDSSKNTLTMDLQKGESKSFTGEYTIQREDAGTSLTLEATATAVNPIDTNKVITVKDKTENAVTVEKEYTLTIKYVYANGNTAAPSLIGKYLEGEAFNIPSPEIYGYEANLAFVRSDANGMPAKDVTMQVIYTATTP